MGIEVITTADLHHFRVELLADIEKLFRNIPTPASPQLEGLKTKHVRKILDCSNGKLQMLRLAGKLHCKKVGGTLYYNRAEVQKLVEGGG